MVPGSRKFQLMQVLVVQTAMGQKALVAVPIAIMMRLILRTVNLQNRSRCKYVKVLNFINGDTMKLSHIWLIFRHILILMLRWRD